MRRAIGAAWLLLLACETSTPRAEDAGTDAGHARDAGTHVGLDAGPGVLVSPMDVDFGTTHVGVVATRGLRVTNATEPRAMPVLYVSGAHPDEFVIAHSTCMTFLPRGGYCDLSIELTPTDVGRREAMLTVGIGTFVARVALAGEADTDLLEITPETASFEATTTTPSASQTFSIASTRSETTVLGSASLAGPDAAQFVVVRDIRALPLRSDGPPATFEIAYAPSVPGHHTATVHVAGASDATIVGDAIQVAQLAFVPAGFDFGALSAFPSAPQTFRLENAAVVASGPLTFGLSGPDAGELAITRNDCPSSLASGRTCTIDVVVDASDVPGRREATLEAGDGVVSASALLFATVSP